MKRERERSLNYSRFDAGHVQRDDFAIVAFVRLRDCNYFTIQSHYI